MSDKKLIQLYGLDYVSFWFSKDLPVFVLETPIYLHPSLKWGGKKTELRNKNENFPSFPDFFRGIYVIWIKVQ